MKSSNYPASEWQPRKLTKEEVAEPLQAIASFFDFANLLETRELLTLWVEATVTGSFNSNLSFRERAEVFYFYQQVEKLIEVAHLIHTTGITKEE